MANALVLIKFIFLEYFSKIEFRTIDEFYTYHKYIWRAGQYHIVIIKV